MTLTEARDALRAAGHRYVYTKQTKAFHDGIEETRHVIEIRNDTAGTVTTLEGDDPAWLAVEVSDWIAKGIR